MALKYSEEVKKNFMHPKNLGKIKNPDGFGEVGNPLCGDVMQLYIKVKDKKDKKIISDIKFKAFGCAAAIASSSMITQLAKNKELNEAKKIELKDIAKSLKGLPPIKMHCANMVTQALKKAIEDYEKNEK